MYYLKEKQKKNRKPVMWTDLWKESSWFWKFNQILCSDVDLSHTRETAMDYETKSKGWKWFAKFDNIM